MYSRYGQNTVRLPAGTVGRDEEGSSLIQDEPWKTPKHKWHSHVSQYNGTHLHKQLEEVAQMFKDANPASPKTN